MQLSKKKVIFIVIVIAVLLAIPFIASIARHLMDSPQTPEQQLDNLSVKTNQEVARIMGGREYSLQDIHKECKNQGQSEFFAFGRDTVWCEYNVHVSSKQSGQTLRKLIEAAGWRRSLYDDGSGAYYGRKAAPICSVYDGNTYHSRKEAEETYVDGLFIIDCQSFTDHYNSSLPAPPQ